MSKIELPDPVTMTAEQIKAIAEDGAKIRKDYEAKWRRSQRSDHEVLEDRVRALETRVVALEAAQRQRPDQ